MVFNLNIVDLTIVNYHEINNTLYKIFFIIPLNYLQFHHVWNTSDNFLGFLKAQQHQVKYNQ